jgi:hypothetical protein
LNIASLRRLKQFPRGETEFLLVEVKGVGDLLYK